MGIYKGISFYRDQGVKDKQLMRLMQDNVFTQLVEKAVRKPKRKFEQN